jgi:hypothetical protein
MDKKIIKFTSQQKKYILNLKPEIKTALTMYTSEIYKEINDFLENELIIKLPESEMPDVIKYIDMAFENAPKTQDELIVYRGISLPKIKNVRRYKKGIPLMNYSGKYKGYISTSLDKDIPDIFITKHDCCKLKITIPKQTKVLYITPLSKITEENEVLINRNSIIKINGFKDNIIEAELLVN